MPCLALLQALEPLLRGQLLGKASLLPVPALHRPMASALRASWSPRPVGPRGRSAVLPLGAQSELSSCCKRGLGTLCVRRRFTRTEAYSEAAVGSPARGSWYVAAQRRHPFSRPSSFLPRALGLPWSGHSPGAPPTNAGLCGPSTASKACGEAGPPGPAPRPLTPPDLSPGLRTPGTWVEVPARLLGVPCSPSETALGVIPVFCCTGLLDQGFGVSWGGLSQGGLRHRGRAPGPHPSPPGWGQSWPAGLQMFPQREPPSSPPHPLLL